MTAETTATTVSEIDAIQSLSPTLPSTRRRHSGGQRARRTRANSATTRGGSTHYRTSYGSLRRPSEIRFLWGRCKAVRLSPTSVAVLEPICASRPCSSASADWRSGSISRQR